MCSLAVVCGLLFAFRDCGLGKKAMLDSMSQCATTRRDSRRAYVQWRMHQLAGCCSPSTGNSSHLVDHKYFHIIGNEGFHFLLCCLMVYLSMVGFFSCLIYYEMQSIGFLLCYFSKNILQLNLICHPH